MLVFSENHESKSFWESSRKYKMYVVESISVTSSSVSILLVGLQMGCMK